MTTVTPMGERRARKLIDSYLRQRVGRGELAASSAEVIHPILVQWCRHVDWTPPPSWNVDQVAEWALDERLRPNTRKSRLTKLRPWCQWLVISEVMPRDPTLGIARIRIPDGAPRDLTPDEVADVIRACPDDRAVLMVVLMAQMGLRCGDVARIRVEDIDRRRRLMHVRAKGGRGEPTHWEPIPAEAWRLVGRWLPRVGRSGPLIPSTWTGRALRPATVGTIVTAAMWDAGVKVAAGDGISPHSLRHTCAQHMIDLGADLREVQYTLGHKTQRSTEIYVRREPPGLREAMEGRTYLAA